MDGSTKELLLHLHIALSTGELKRYDAMVDQIEGARSAIILLEGRAGVGKTSLLKCLEMEMERPSIFIDLSHSDFHNDESTLQTYMNRMAVRDKKCVFLMDGFDVFVHECKWELSAFFPIVKNTLLQNCNIIIACRPSAVDQLRNHFKISYHYIVMGFFPEGANVFLKTFSKTDEYEQISVLLSRHLVLKRMCTIPLVCSQLIEILREMKFRLFNITLTDIVHKVVVAIIKREFAKSGELSLETIVDLHSFPSKFNKSLDVISRLALSDLVHSCESDSMYSLSFFLSSFCLENSISSLQDIKTFGLMGYCIHDSYYLGMSDQLYWYLSPEIRDFLAAFTLHQYPPMDQLYFLIEHTQKLLDAGYHGWLQFFYGLTVQREAEYNPTRMMMATLSEVLVWCLNLEKDSSHLILFINCLMEAHEESLWRKVGAKCGNIYDMELSASDIESMRIGIVEMIEHSGFKEWTIEMHPDRMDVGTHLKMFVTRVKIELRQNFDLCNNIVRLRPKRSSSGLLSKRSVSSTPQKGSLETEEEKLKLDLLCCRAVREILQRVLQLFSAVKLKADSSNPSYISFLTCECFEKAVKDRFSFEPLLPTLFLPIENKKHNNRKTTDVTSFHLLEEHEGRALEHVILLQPCLRKIKFVLPSGDEEFEISICGDCIPDVTYSRFVSTMIEELEEIVECCAAHDLSPLKTKEVLPSMLIPKDHSELTEGTVAPAIHLPPDVPSTIQHKSKIGISAPHVSSTGKTEMKTQFSQKMDVCYSQQVSSDKGPSLKVSSIQNYHTSGQMAIAIQSTQPPSSSKKLTAMKPGTVVFTTVPDRISTDRIHPLPDESILIRRGGNGQIFSSTVGGLNVAIKKTAYRSKEHAILTKVKHKNIVQLLAFMWGEENPTYRRRYFCYHIMPKMTGDFARMVTDKQELMLKNLWRLHKDSPRLMGAVQGNTRFILTHVLQGLSYLHSLHIAHRDLKASNILFKMNCSCDNPLLCSCSVKYTLVICDFDAAVQLDDSNHLLPSLTGSHLHYQCIPVGTSGFRAPECYMHITAGLAKNSVEGSVFSPPISTKCDVFSFGVLCIRLMIGEEGPESQRVVAMMLLNYYQSMSLVEGKDRHSLLISDSLIRKILKIPKLQREMKWFKNSFDFVECCLRVNPSERSTADKLLTHSFLHSRYSLLPPSSS